MTAAALPQIHQFLPTFAGAGDAASAHAAHIRRTLDEAGYGGFLYAEHDRSETPFSLAHPLDDHAAHAREGDLLLYTLAVGSVVGDYVLQRPEPVLVDFLNITPPSFFRRWPPDPGEPDVTWAVEWGLRQRDQLADKALAAMTASEFNRRQLIEAGYGWTEVLPILFDPSVLDRPSDVDLGDDLDTELSRSGTRWLFVGRVTPNKCQHDVVMAFAAYREVFDPTARLDIVGGVSPGPYERALRGTIHELGLDDAVTLTGAVSDAELGARYRAADIFVCLSQHEGFCVPLVEAMYHRVPVVARRAGAVSETAGDGAVLLDDPTPARVAAAVHGVLDDGRFRAELVTAGRAEVDRLSLSRAENQLRQFVAAAVRAAGSAG